MRFQMKLVPAFAAALLAASPAFAQSSDVEFPAPSPLATVQQRVGLTDVEIVYSRPGVKDREIFGGLVPYGEVWRTGANAATRVTFSTDVRLQGARLEAGAYELFTIPGRDEWTIIVQKLSDNASWGAYSYEPENDTARVTAKPVTLPTPVETFTIGIGDLRDTSATLFLEWEKTRVPLQLELDTVALLMPRIKEAIAADADRPWNFYYGAASLLHANDGDTEQALEWVDESLERRGDYPGSLLLRTRLLAELGRNKEARDAAEKTIVAGKKLEGPDSVMARQARDIADSLK